MLYLKLINYDKWLCVNVFKLKHKVWKYVYKWYMCACVMEIHNWLMAFRRLKVYKLYSSRWRIKNHDTIWSISKAWESGAPKLKGIKNGGAQLKHTLSSPLCVGRQWEWMGVGVSVCCLCVFGRFLMYPLKVIHSGKHLFN